MQFFGTPSTGRRDVLLEWRLKTKSNEELRQRFFDMFVPKLWDLGISVPDPILAYNEAKGEWDWTDPDWDSFWKVVKGEGPRTQARLEMRRLTHAEHAWVREVMNTPPRVAA